VPPATAQQRVNHRTAFAGVGMPNEHPIAFSKGAWANRIFDFVMPRRILCRVVEKNFDISSTGH